jgi:phenylpropionate dioxygenase-like ring-hydroxylating dioxygenase large terminal subunit
MDIATNEPTTLPIPNGWFAVAWSKDLVPGQVLRVRCFDEEIALFRTRSGEVKAINAYCPHLGAHMAEGGRVVGEHIRCPFHAWEYGGDGVCKKIPYTDRIPPKARVRSWDVCELNLMIFIWHHAEHAAPYWEVPEMPELSTPGWTEPRYFELEVPVHMQDMHENNCDPVHFKYVHGMTDDVGESKVSYGEDRRFFRISSVHTRETPMGSFETELERDSWGLGLSAVRTIGIPDAGLLMFSSTSPVDANHTQSRWLFTVTENLVDLVGEDFIEGMEQGVMQDMRIWSNKIHRPAPVLCEADKLLADFRDWTKQFYSTNGHGK